MKGIIIFSIILFTLAVEYSQAQKLTKEEKKKFREREKELKREFKEYYKDIYKFVELKEEKVFAKRKTDSLINAIREVQENKTQKREELAILQSSHINHKTKIQEIEEKIHDIKQSGIPSKGTFYIVKMKRGSENDQGYIFGMYTTENKANELKKQIISLGGKMPQTLVYKDGKFIKIIK